MLSLKDRILCFKEVAKSATWVIEPNGEVWWSPELYELYGMKQGEGLKSGDFKDKVFPPDWVKFDKTINESFQRKENFDMKVRVYIGSKYQWMHIRGIVLKDGSLRGVTQNIDYYFRDYYQAMQDLNLVKALASGPNKNYDRIKEILK